MQWLPKMTDEFCNVFSFNVKVLNVQADLYIRTKYFRSIIIFCKGRAMAIQKSEVFYITEDVIFVFAYFLIKKPCFVHRFGISITIWNKVSQY